MNIASGGISWIDILYMLNNKTDHTPPQCVCVKKINQVMMMMKNGSISSTFVFEQQF